MPFASGIHLKWLGQNLDARLGRDGYNLWEFNKVVIRIRQYCAALLHEQRSSRAEAQAIQQDAQARLDAKEAINPQSFGWFQDALRHFENAHYRIQQVKQFPLEPIADPLPIPGPVKR
jgi:hypothetical protein